MLSAGYAPIVLSLSWGGDILGVAIRHHDAFLSSSIELPISRRAMVANATVGFYFRESVRDIQR